MHLDDLRIFKDIFRYLINQYCATDTPNILHKNANNNDKIKKNKTKKGKVKLSDERGSIYCFFFKYYINI